jgi:hypothetical protein
VITRRLEHIVLMDRDDLAAWLGRSSATIRALCQPVTYDEATGRALYDAEACQARLADVAKRRRLAQ